MAYLKGKKKPTAAMVKRAALQRKALAKAESAARPHSKAAAAADAAAAREAAVRAAAVSVMHFLFGENPRVHYPFKDKRTMTIHHIATRAQLEQQLAHNLTIDCSQAMTLIAHVAGAKDPNGRDYREDGFTGTLIDGCRPITRAQARPGDMRIFGRGTGHHVGMVLAPGADPLLFSHGQEKGPLLIRESVEARFQPSGGAFIRLPI
jgi:cell wall-associated NlpC family hydrolase